MRRPSPFERSLLPSKFRYEFMFVIYLVSLLFNYRKKISRRILKPGDIRALALIGATKDPFLVGFHFTFIGLEFHTKFGKLVHGDIDILDRKIEHGEGRRLMIAFRINENVIPAIESQFQALLLLFDFNT